MNRSTIALLVTASAVIGTATAALIAGVGSTPGSDGLPDRAHVVVCGTTSPDAIDGACYLPTEYDGHPTLDTTAYGTDIAHCASDDWNSTHISRCYTERVTDGAVIILDASDSVIAELTPTI